MQSPRSKQPVESLPFAAAAVSLLPESERGKTILLVDDEEVLYRPHTRRVLQPLQRHPANPVVVGREKPWEVAIAWNSVYRDPVTGRYQMWYQAWSGDKARERTHRCVVCYAESPDGVQWTKPSLGLFRYNDQPDTNIVLVGKGGVSVNYGAAVVVDPRDPDPTRCYKMAYFDFAREGDVERPGLHVAFSPDGIHWTPYPRAPLLRAAYFNLGDPVPFADERETAAARWRIPLSISDAMDVFFDPLRQRFVMYHKMWIDQPDGTMGWKHGMGRTESSDFLTWSASELVLSPDEFDPDHLEFHHTPVFFYNGRYFALLQDLNRGERGGVIDIELALSRDGWRWERPFRQPFFLARSPAGFDSGSLFTNGTPVLLKDEFRFYYGGYDQGATGADARYEISGIGLATLPRDRFAALTSQGGPAQVTLKPVSLGGGGALTLNAAVGTGEIRVELLDAEGYRQRGYYWDEAVPLTGDSLRHPIRWRERSLADLPPGRYMPRLHLRGEARVFALTCR